MRFWLYGVLLGLLGFGSLPLAALGQATIELEINNTSADTDDYIGWTPVRGQIRQVNGTTDLAVVLESTQPDPKLKSGEVAFGPFTAAPPTPATWNPQASLNITLPANGTPKGFWVAGKVASSDGKDVRILVKDAKNNVLKQHPVMVRVRKNAESLTDLEVKRFLDALAWMH